MPNANHISSSTMRFNEGKSSLKRGRSVLFSVIVALTLLVVFLLLVYDSNYNLDAEEFVILAENLHFEFDGFKIVHLSDLHGAQFGENNSKLLKIISEAQPDIIVITGDIVENRKDIPNLQKYSADIAAIAPTYYVPGNHEYATRQSGVIFQKLRDTGITVLRNQSAMIKRNNSEIMILGIDDPLGRADMMKMEDVYGLARSKTDSFILTICHRYERFEEYAELGMPLVLTGHAHGGLIRLPFTDGIIGPGRVLFPKYTNGMYSKDDTIMITSRGIGNASISLRLFNRPHIPVITLKCAEKK